jgi:signal transduction histidine kinase
MSVLIALAQNGQGQTAVHWSFYKTADGLPEQVFNSVSFTPQGKLIAASVNAGVVSELDGYSVSNFSAPAGFVGRVYESPGGQRWALSPEGLLEFKNDAWLPHPVPEIAAEFPSRPIRQETAPTLVPIRQGCVLLLLPERLMEFSAKDPDHPRTVVLREAARTGIGSFSGMAISPDGVLWICGAHGLARAANQARNLSPEMSWQEFVPPQSLQLENLISPEADDSGGITVVAESAATHEKIAVTFDGHHWTVLPAGPENFLRAWRGPNRTFWAATTESLFQWDEAAINWVEIDDISVGRIFDVTVEPGGAFWLATSEGLIRGSAELWQQPQAVHGLNSSVQCIAADSNNRILFIAGNKLHMLDNGQLREFTLPSVSKNPQPTYGIFPMVSAPMLVEVGNSLFQFRPEDGMFKSFRPQNRLRMIALGYLPTGSLCLSTPGFEEFDGGQARPWKSAPEADGSDARFTTLFAARNGDFWLGGEGGVLWRHGDQWQPVACQNQTGPEIAVGFAETSEGKIWCATPDELWEFDGKNWLLLQNKFNHINMLVQSRDGSIWLASNGGLFRFYKGAWLESSGEDGFPSGPVRAVCEDWRGQIWAATARGLRVFHPEAAPDSPRTFVRQLAGDSQLSGGNTLNVLLEGRTKWKLVSPGRLLYSCQLDQDAWSTFRDVTVPSFPGLAAGKHYFQVRAIDPAGNLEVTPAALDFTITVPWFREIRLWVVLLLGLAIAIFFAAVAWNRHRQLVLSHAAVERKVAERTRELEIATRELVHGQKMNALGTLAAGIAHDFNNILSIIKGSAQIIEDNPDQPDKIRTRVDRIKAVVQQGAEIVDAMLGFSRGSDARPLPCDVNAVVADTVKLLGDRFLREVVVKFERAEMPPEIFASREFIQQILLNFIFNAAEAMNGQKQITLVTSVTGKLPPDIFLAPVSSGPFVLISVSDRGAGIAPENMPRIFEPFFTTKALSARRGTGLGLSMVYELAKKMNAGLAVQSVVGRGSTFTLILTASNQDSKVSSENSK